jgi:hypothetical protein
MSLVQSGCDRSDRIMHFTFTPCFALLLLFVAVTSPLMLQGVGAHGSPQSKAASTMPSPVAGQLSQDPVKSELEREKLKLEVDKLRIDNANAERSLTTTRGWLNLLYGNVSVIVAVVLGFWGLFRYIRERHEELLKREDERFEEVVRGLGSETDQQRVSSAVLLPTFLRKGYERFYLQVFNLAAGNLRASTSNQSAPFARALTSVFRESYPRARNALKEQPGINEELHTGRYLNAEGVKLDGAFLAGADLSDAWLRGASFREATLRGANLTKAILEGSDCVAAELAQATLCEANLKSADFSRADLENADFSGARADSAKFNGADLTDTTMYGGTVGGADFSGANLTKAKFRGVIFASASPDGEPANPEAAEKLSGSVFDNVTGLTNGQIVLCKEKGAVFTPESP